MLLPTAFFKVTVIKLICHYRLVITLKQVTIFPFMRLASV